MWTGRLPVHTYRVSSVIHTHMGCLVLISPSCFEANGMKLFHREDRQIDRYVHSIHSSHHASIEPPPCQSERSHISIQLRPRRGGVPLRSSRHECPPPHLRCWMQSNITVNERAFHISFGMWCRSVVLIAVYPSKHPLLPLAVLHHDRLMELHE